MMKDGDAITKTNSNNNMAWEMETLSVSLPLYEYICINTCMFILWKPLLLPVPNTSRRYFVSGVLVHVLITCRIDIAFIINDFPDPCWTIRSHDTYYRGWPTIFVFRWFANSVYQFVELMLQLTSMTCLPCTMEMECFCVDEWYWFRYISMFLWKKVNTKCVSAL